MSEQEERHDSAVVPEPPHDLPPEEPGACCSRRRFIGMAGLGVAGLGYAAGMAYPVYRYLADPAERAAAEAAVKEVTLAKADAPAVGQGKNIKFGIRPALLIHHAEGKWSCFIATCTHLGCTVAYKPAEKSIKCPCHGGIYDATTGANVSGPPPKPLTQLTVEENNDQLIIRRV